MENKLFFLEHTDPEFNVAFSHFPDPVMRNAEYHECLQYMGTVVAPSGTAHHEFRHRAVPGTNERRYWKIPVSTALTRRIQAKEFKLS
jgi:hypothetical protein